MLNINLLCLEGMLFSSLSLPAEMFQAAEDHHLGKRARPQLRLRLLAPTPKPARCLGGVAITPDMSLAQWRRAKLPCTMLLIPSLWRDPQRALTPHLTRLTDFARRLHADGAILCAVGTGSALLAEAGLLDERPATTHWHHLKTFAQRYPAVTLRPNHLITAADNLCCAGSVNSVADLAVHLIGEFYDSDTAAHVENNFSPEIRRSFDEHAWRDDGDVAHHDEEIVRVQEWLRNASAPNLDDLARRFNLNPRTLSRRFKAAVGDSPARWHRRQRLEQARRLLLDSDASVTMIGAQLGFANASHFIDAFRRWRGRTPAQYRRMARKKLFRMS